MRCSKSVEKLRRDTQRRVGLSSGNVEEFVLTYVLAGLVISKYRTGASDPAFAGVVRNVQLTQPEPLSITSRGVMPRWIRDDIFRAGNMESHHR